MKMRLDKYLCEVLDITRKQANQILKSASVSINGKIEKSGALKLQEQDKVFWQEKLLSYLGSRYIMLHKPSNFVCSHESDGDHLSVFNLLDEPKIKNLHFAGRLDLDTTGLLLITDDGKWSHRITSPKHKCAKTYRVWLADPIGEHYVFQCEQGIKLQSEIKLTLPAKLEIINPSKHELLLTITEGKYHQVKRMFAALGNKVIKLHREKIGSLQLEPTLAVGEYRHLTAKEVNSLYE